MKSQLIKRVISLVMTVCAGVICMSAAQPKLYIPDFTVQGDGPVSVDIMLDNPVPVIAYSFTIEMPDGLEIVAGSAQKTSRFNEGQQFGFRNNVFAVVSMQDLPFFKEYGSVGTFKVMPTTAPTGERDVTITLKNISIVAKDFSNNVTIPELTTTVTITEKEDPVNITMSVMPESAVVNPGGVQEVSVAMDNNAPIQGLQMTLMLPVGFSLVGTGSGIFEQTSRLGGGATIESKTNGNSTNIVISDIFANQVLDEGEGEFVKFKIQMPEDFKEESAQIEIVNVQASVNFKTKRPASVSMALTNGVIAYNMAQAEISTLKETLSEAIATIAEECPDVKDNFPGDQISGLIDSLESDVEIAYEDLSLTDNYETVMAPAADINSAIESLVEAAKAAQKANDDEVAAELARQEAYKNANALLESLTSSLDNALITIEENYPDVKDYFTGENIAAAIISMQKAIDAAYEDKSLVENYEELTAPATGIQDSIAKLIEDAKNAQEEFENNAAAEAARLEAYKKANEVVEGLNNSLKETLATIDGNCPDVKDSFKGTDIAKAISDMQASIDTALENKTIVDKYDDLVAPATAIQESIDKLLEDAEASQKAYEENADLESARLKANEALAALDKALAEALSEIEKECPDVKHLYTGAAVQQQITVLRNAVNAAYENKTLADNYDEVMAPEADITASISKLVEDAKAAQKELEEADTALNQAYVKANALVDELSGELETALITIEENYPDVKDYFKGQEISAAIADLKKSIENSYKDKTLTQNYDEVTAPEKAIRDSIAKLVSDAEASQKAYEENAALESARLKANEALAALDKALAEALAEIEKECPDVKHLYTGAAVQQQITVLRNAVNTAYDNKTLADNYDDIMAPEADIKAAIAKLVNDAKAAQKSIEDAESARQKYNAEAYEADIAVINELLNKLEAAKIEMMEKYPTYDYTSTYEKIAAAIAALKARADKEYQRVEDEGKYAYELDPMPVEEMIEKMLNDARLSGVDIILTDEFTGDYRIFTTNGQQVPAIQRGKVNIIQKSDGTSLKVFVK